MDPLYAKAHGKVGRSSTKSKSSRKSKRSSRSQSAGQPTGRPHLGDDAGEPSSESRKSKSKRTSKDTARSDSDGSSKAAAATMNVMNALDAAIGVSYIVGATMDPDVAVTAVAMSLGSVLLLSSLFGVIGYCSKSSNRAELLLSIFLSTLACLSYVGGFVWALVSWDSFEAFLDSDQQFLGDYKIPVIVLLAVMVVFETIRIITTNITRKDLLKQDAHKSGSYRSTSTCSSSSSWGFLSWFGLAKKKRSDDFVMFDDNASMESALLWSKDGGQPSSDDYLEFVPDHERGLANYASNVALPLPPEDKMDY